MVSVTNLKTNIFERLIKKRPVKPLRYRLTGSFIMFAVLLMGVLWLMQAVFLSRYYEYSMEKKVTASTKAIEALYTGSELLTYDEFCNALGLLSQEADVMFYIEAQDGSFVISSTDQTPGGRIFANSRNLISDAKLKMLESGESEISFSTGGRDTETTLVHAKLVRASRKPAIIVFAIASLTPIGPAVSIIRSQLFIVTIIALVLSAFFARWLSKRLAKPIVGMGENAKTLAKGNYDVTFEGGHDFKEIDELADTLTETASELKKADSLQRDLMANVSHDLRTPLTMIKSYAEMIRDLSGDIPQKRDEHLGVIIDETDRLSDLVNDVLTLSKMQSNVIEFEDKEFDIQKAAESVYSTYMVLEQEGYAFSLHSVPETIIVRGDERRIKQVIANLLSNAVRYSEDVKEISLSFAVSCGYIKCEVRDRGVGISPEDLDKIWDRYEKASATGQRSQNGGTGLGLSIAAEILKRHSAEYGVESTVGEGSCFWFKLPIA